MQFENFRNFPSGLLLFFLPSLHSLVSSNDINLFGFLVFGRGTKVDATKWRLAGEIVACICIFSASAWPPQKSECATFYSEKCTPRPPTDPEFPFFPTIKHRRPCANNMAKMALGKMSTMCKKANIMGKRGRQ